MVESEPAHGAISDRIHHFAFFAQSFTHLNHHFRLGFIDIVNDFSREQTRSGVSRITMAFCALICCTRRKSRSWRYAR